jgi:hypothetical protein
VRYPTHSDDLDAFAHSPRETGHACPAQRWNQPVAQSAYDDAHGKLSTGRGNLVGQAQKLRQLGAKPSKSLAPALVDGAYESDELPFVLEEDLVQAPSKLGSKPLQRNGLLFKRPERAQNHQASNLNPKPPLTG